MPEKEINLEEVTKRLDLVIYLLIKQRQEKEEVSKRGIIGEMSEWGLKDNEIAKILGKTKSYISSELTKFRKSKKK